MIFTGKTQTVAVITQLSQRQIKCNIIIGDLYKVTHCFYRTHRLLRCHLRLLYTQLCVPSISYNELRICPWPYSPASPQFSIDLCTIKGPLPRQVLDFFLKATLLKSSELMVATNEVFAKIQANIQIIIIPRPCRAPTLLLRGPQSLHPGGSSCRNP